MTATPVSEARRIDRFSVGLFIARNPRRENKKRHDDVVAAISYIGPRVDAQAG